jgi:hypothetical protein
MDNQGNSGAPSQPQSTNDANPTRYFPPQETSMPEVPYSGPQQYQQGPPVQGQPQSGNSGGYAQPQYGSYGQIQQTTQPYKAQGDRRGRDRTILALALIGGGLLFLLDGFSFFPSFGEMVLLLIGGIFMYAYFSSKPGYNVGFLIPGAILLGIGTGSVLENIGVLNAIFGYSISGITLGLGFCAIWFFERKHWWALIPGGIILLGSLSSMFRLFALWPLVLVALGIFLLYEQSRRQPR